MKIIFRVAIIIIVVYILGLNAYPRKSKFANHHKKNVKGWLDMGAWTHKKGAFGWYADFPVGKG